MKTKVTLENIIAYIQGNIRYKIFYSKFPWLLRKTIRTQIDFRISMMREKCYSQGSCEICGCRTTHLQMANKSCDGPCYPPLMSRRNWKKFIKEGQSVFIKNTFWNCKYHSKTNNLIIYKDWVEVNRKEL